MADQLKLFMSAREIMGEYQPLDADRHVAGFDPPAHITNYGPKELATDPSARPNRNGFRDVRNRIRSGDVESDEEVWNRKANEATQRKPIRHGFAEPLASSIETSGVQMPVHLSEQFGAVGKKAVAGGHHRIAGSALSDPDRLMPVIHHRSPGEAANAKHGYRYT